MGSVDSPCTRVSTFRNINSASVNPANELKLKTGHCTFQTRPLRSETGQHPPRPIGTYGDLGPIRGTVRRGVQALLAQFKSDRSSGLLLPDRCAIRRVPAGGDVIDPDGDDITAAQLSVDRQIEHGEAASVAFDLEFRPYRPDVFGSQRRLCRGPTATLPHSNPHG
jgi:hypothetical protein